MRSSHMLLVLGAVLALSSASVQASECPGDPGYALIVSPTDVPLGTPFITNVTAPQNSLVLILVSATAGPTPSAYGTLCVGLPLHGVVNFVMPLPSISFAHYIDCQPVYVGLEGHLQFLAVNPAEPNTVHVSNSQSFHVIDGVCPTLDFLNGDLATFTMGGWGTACHGKNPGCLRDQFFATAFPNGLILGDQDGVDGDSAFALVLNSSAAVQNFLPSGGTAGALTSNLVNPTGATAAGVFAGQLAAAKINARFDDLGFLDSKKKLIGVSVSDLRFVAGVHPSLIGKTVDEVLAISDLVISGAVAVPYDVDGDTVGDVGYAELSAALDAVNMNFDNGTSNLGFLGAP